MNKRWLRSLLTLMIAMALVLPGAWAEAPGEAPDEALIAAETVDDAAELGEIDLYDPSVYAEDVPGESLIIEEETPVPEITETPEATETPEVTEDPEPDATSVQSPRYSGPALSGEFS